MNSIATPSDIDLDDRSRELRKLVVRTIAAGRRGHLGAAFSIVEILRVLYDSILRYDPSQPRWPGRDRFILSKGHGCVALYVMLAEKGFIPTDALWNFCKNGALLGGHPEHAIPGVEASTGSLGHGLPIGLGFALNAKLTAGQHRVFVLVGDGECNEGSVWESAMCAAKHRLSNLTVLVDYNKQQSYGTTAEVLDLEPLADKWRSFGFGVVEVNGHDVAELRNALTILPRVPDRPTALICHTVKGKGVEFTERNLAWHHKSKVTDEEVGLLLKALEPS